MSGTQFGEPFEGIGIIGFDPGRGSVSSARTDNTAGALFQSTGYPVGDGTALRLFGRSDGPGDGEFDCWWRIELQRADNGRLSQRYYDLAATGDGVRVFETRFTRRK